MKSTYKFIGSIFDLLCACLWIKAIGNKRRGLWGPYAKLDTSAQKNIKKQYVDYLEDFFEA